MLFFTITNLKSARKHKWRGELLSRLFWIQQSHILISIFFSMFVWPLPSISAEFLSNKVASVDTVWWRDMSLVTTILLYFNVVILVHYPITIYINLLNFLYYVCLCNFNFFLKFIFTFSFAKNFIFCKLFSKIKLFLTYLLYFPLCTPHYTFHVSLLFYWSHLTVGTVPSSDSSLFRKSSTIGQLNVHAAAAENEEQYTLSNILYIAFQNSYSFLWCFL